MDTLQGQSAESEHNAAERKKSNLAFAFFCMDKDRAKDMEIFYAFCRLMDDIADEEVRPVPERRAQLTAWKEEIAKIYRGEKNLSPLAEEMRGVIERRNVPQQYVQDIIDGVLTDTLAPEFKTFEDIRKYCYGVASAVGLVSIHIFGFKNERTKLFAEALGYALQFTNILRDVVDDAVSHGRVYIPQDELDAFGVSRADLKNPRANPACKKLFAFLYFRAKHFFNKARRLIAEEDRRSLTPAFIMWAIYERILESLKERDFDITEKPLKISKPKKIALALAAIRDAKRPHAQNELFGRAVVIGAGIAGMATATRLALEGFDVDVFETRKSAGGRACKIDAFQTQIDNASHAAMGCYENFFRAVELSGGDVSAGFEKVSGMDFISPDAGTVSVKYPKRGGLISRAFSALSYAKLESFACARNIALLLSVKLGLRANPSETAAEFLRRKKIPQRVIDTFWEPFCVSALNTATARADANLMIKTLRKSILRGFDNAVLFLPARPIADSFAHFATYIRGCGGTVRFGDAAEKIEISNGRATAVVSAKSGQTRADWFFPAVTAKQLAQLLGDAEISERLARIRTTGILNIYFQTPRKIIPSEYACIVDSPIHWIFDHTRKLPDGAQTRLYSATISDCTAVKSKDAAREFLRRELSKIFGEVEIGEVLPVQFADATISADSETEAARPAQSFFSDKIPNLRPVGDWLQTDLPCTMESAAKSAFDTPLDR